MKTRISVFSAMCLVSCFLIVGLLSPVAADYDDYADRLSREHRVANEVDEWIERGSATITASPRFEEGVRLTAWANAAQNADDYEFAIASAVYLFEIPVGTQYIEILVRYRGDPHRIEIEDYEEPIAGRAWIRNTKRESTRRGYYDENAEETRYGDTFVLRSKNRSERIKIPAVGHVKDGWMELHIVAEGGEQIDVEYIEVSSYRRQPKVRVIQRYTPTYRWRPWHRYTYLYFYDGPVYYATDHDYYLRWSYPSYDHHYLSIRSYYGGYLGRYHSYYPSAYYRNYSPYYGSYQNYYRGTPKVHQRRTQLNRWSTQHEATRRQYSRSRLSANNRQVERVAVRRSVRTTLENHRKQTPATTERVARQSIIAQKRRALASASTLRQSSVRRSTYSAPERALTKQRDPLTAQQDVNRYNNFTNTQRTAPLYRRSNTSSSRSFSSSTSSSSVPKYRSTTSNSSASRANPSVSRSRTTSSSRERTSVSRSRTTSSSRSSSSRTSVSRSTSTKSTKTRTRPTTSTTSSSSTSRSSSSSSKDDDDKGSQSRSRTTERTKRRR